MIATHEFSSLAYRAGVTSAVTAPLGTFYSGYSTAFSTGAAHKLDDRAVLKSIAAFHTSIRHVGLPSVSSQIAALRNLLLDGPSEGWSGKVIKVRLILPILALYIDTGHSRARYPWSSKQIQQM
jgi:hypothetical protein